jgi:hypothetical protein
MYSYNVSEAERRWEHPEEEYKTERRTTGCLRAESGSGLTCHSRGHNLNARSVIYSI